MTDLLNVDWLKSNHKMIHYFGLGFIQLKLDDRSRVHFYTPELEPTVSEEEIHNHRYDFTSIILKGEFAQEFFDITGGDTHLLEIESCKEGVDPGGVAVKCGVKKKSSHRYLAGSSYFVSHEVFHRVSGTNCITFVERGNYAKDHAEVVRKMGSPKVCPFGKKVAEEQLWEIVDRMIKE